MADWPPELIALANIRQKADSRCRRFLRRIRRRNDKIIRTGQRWHAVPGATSGRSVVNESAPGSPRKPKILSLRSRVGRRNLFQQGRRRGGGGERRLVWAVYRLDRFGARMAHRVSNAEKRGAPGCVPVSAGVSPAFGRAFDRHFRARTQCRQHAGATLGPQNGREPGTVGPCLIYKSDCYQHGWSGMGAPPLTFWL